MSDTTIHKVWVVERTTYHEAIYASQTQESFDVCGVFSSEALAKDKIKELEKVVNLDESIIDCEYTITEHWLDD